MCDQRDKSTEDLEKVITKDVNTYDDFKMFLDRESINNKSYHEYMSELIYEKGYTKEQVYKKADISRSYGRKILGGETGIGMKKRDLIIRISYVSDFQLYEVNRVLKLAGLSELYVKQPRDAALILAFNKNSVRSLDSLNEFLKELKFDTFD